MFVDQKPSNKGRAYTKRRRPNDSQELHTFLISYRSNVDRRFIERRRPLREATTRRLVFIDF